MTPDLRLGGWNTRNLFSHSSGGCESHIKGPANLVSGRSPLPGSLLAVSSMSPPLWARGEGSLGVLLKRKLIQLDQGRTLMTSFNLTSLWALSANAVTLGVGASTQGFWGRHKHSAHGVSSLDSIKYCILNSLNLNKPSPRSSSIFHRSFRLNILSYLFLSFLIIIIRLWWNPVNVKKWYL